MEDDIINNNCWSKVKQGCASEYRKCKNLCDEFGILVFVLLCICGVIVFVAGVESKNPAAITIGSLLLLPVLIKTVKGLVDHVRTNDCHCCCRRRQYQELDREISEFV